MSTWELGAKPWTGVVLAGGKSSRMGSDKALLELGGKTLLEHALDILQPHIDDLLVIGHPDRHGDIGPFVIADDMPGMGPLGGIVTALRYAVHDRVFVLACDMPGITASFIERMKAVDDDHDAFIPQCDGQLEPLAAVYHRRCRSIFEGCLARGEWKVADALERVRTRYVQICPGEGGWPTDLFRNLNDPSDL